MKDKENKENSFDTEKIEADESIHFDMLDNDDDLSDNSQSNAVRVAQSAFETMLSNGIMRKKVFRTVLIISLVVFVIIGSFFAVHFFFKLEKFEIEGSTQYSNEDIIRASGLTVGENIYSIDKNAAIQKITTTLPYIGSVKIRRYIPSTVKIIVEEEVPRYYFTLCDEYFILSENLRVLQKTSYIGDFLMNYTNIIKLNPQNMTRVVVGEAIVFENEEYYEYARDMLLTFINSKISDSITLIDFTDRFNVFVIYSDRLKIEFGNTDNISRKIEFAIGMIEQLSVKDEGVINVENDTGFYKIESIKGKY